MKIVLNKVILINLAIIVFLIFFSSLFLNIYAQRYDLRRLGPLYMQYPDSCENMRYVLKPYAIASLAGIEYRINSLGFRDNEYTISKPEGSYRILCVGDSITFGQGVKLEDVYAKVLERELQRRYSKDIEVINAGVCGYNTSYEYWYIKNKLVALNPDLIILGFFIGNDPEDRSLEFNNKMVINDNASNSFVYHFKTKLNGKRLEKEDYWIRYMNMIWDAEGPQWKRCVKALKGIKDLTAKNNIALLIFVLPNTEPNPLSRSTYHCQLIDMLKELNINYVDVLPELVKRCTFYLPVNKDDRHPNAQMHEIYTQVVLRTLEAKGIVQINK